MAQTVNLSQSTVSLGLAPVWRSTPLALTGTVSTPALTTWRAQLWRRPQDCRDADVEPLATVYGTVTSGMLNLAFSAAQMDIDLTAGNGAYDDLWLMIGKVDSEGEPHVVKADWLRVQEGGFNPDEYPTTMTNFTIEDDIVTVEYGGTSYQIQGVEIATPEGVGEGSIVVIDDIVYFTPEGSSTSWAVQGVPQGI